MATAGSYPKRHKNVPYSEESSLNTLDVYIPRPPDENTSNRFWIVYIHGGAWRDPEIDAASFETTQNALLASSIADRIAGYATINYRLSSYPSHPTDPSDPSDPARNAKHPDHITDVLTALLYLQETYSFEDRYILVGHSCGATLAFQVAMKRFWGSQYESTYALELNVEPPIAIVGVAGIYDISGLVKNHADQPVYKDFIVNAFGPAHWDVVSPSHGNYGSSWADGQLVVIGHSPDDSLVEQEQVDFQLHALRSSAWTDKGRREAHFLEMHGEHDDLWRTEELARSIEFAVQRFLDL